METLTPLLGLWRGSGRGGFPTIEAFDYIEELKFESNGCEPLLHFEQRTWRRSPGGEADTPLHWESGFFRPTEEGLEISNTQNGGRVEVLKGCIEEAGREKGILSLRVESILLGNDPRLLRTRRLFFLAGNTLRYTVEMATTRAPDLQVHLEALLTRVAEKSREIS